jgi:ATP-dependent Clp protease ATP-binding subunit ClpA
MYEHFTEKAIKVIMLAQEESRSLGHNFVATEQILLGLIGEGTGIASGVLRSKGVSLKAARIEVEKIIGRGSGFVSAVEIPFTPRAQCILDSAAERAKQLDHKHIGTEHLLLGLINQPEGVAIRVLENMSISLASLENDVLAAITASGVTPILREEEKPTDAQEQTLHLIDTSRFTAGAMEAIIFAREETRKAKLNLVGTEQLLLGLLQSRGDAASVLQGNGLDFDTVRSEVDKITKVEARVPIDIPFSYKADKVIVGACRESRAFQHHLVHSDHLLLALIREGHASTARQILQSLGVSFVRMEEFLIENLTKLKD